MKRGVVNPKPVIKKAPVLYLTNYSQTISFILNLRSIVSRKRDLGNLPRPTLFFLIQHPSNFAQITTPDFFHSRVPFFTMRKLLSKIICCHNLLPTLLHGISKKV